MKKIKLTQGKYALVDDEDYEWLSQWKWYFKKTGISGYAVRGVFNGKNMSKIFMHREIAKTPTGLLTDHINRKKLDNRRKNLRVVTHSENSKNVMGKGYYWEKASQKWHAQIAYNNANNYLGRFDNERKARLAYLVAHKKLHT